MIKAKSRGNKTTQQKDINWSNLILGKDALIQMNANTRILDLIPRIRADINPSSIEVNNV